MVWDVALPHYLPLDHWSCGCGLCVQSQPEEGECVCVCVCVWVYAYMHVSVSVLSVYKCMFVKSHKTTTRSSSD